MTFTDSKLNTLGFENVYQRPRLCPELFRCCTHFGDLHSYSSNAFVLLFCLCDSRMDRDRGQWKMNRSERQHSRWKWLKVVCCHLQTLWLPVCSAHIRALMSKLWSFWTCKRHLVYNGLHIKQKSTLKPWKSDWKKSSKPQQSLFF